MPSAPDPNLASDCNTSTDEAIGILLQFGAMMLRAGNTATRTRSWLEVIANNMGLDRISVSISLDCIAASIDWRGERVTAIREIGPPVMNAYRIVRLEQLAKTLLPKSSPRKIANKLADIESVPPLYSTVPVAAAIGLASGGFAFLNGAGTAEMTTAAIAGCLGQWLRLWMAHRQLNQYGAVALSAIGASGAYVLMAALANQFGFSFSHYAAGFIASVLFLVPGIPLVAGLFDLLQNQTVAAVGRAAYGVMILLSVALGLSIVIAVADIELSRRPALEIAYPLKLSLRAIASFIAGAAFAMLFNSPGNAVLAAGLLALAANSLRLVLSDMGMMLPPATFLAALTIGVVVLWMEQCFDLPLMTTTVAPIIIMMPGLHAFEMIVLFNHGQMIEALQASSSCGFTIGALGMGLATATMLKRK